MPSDKTAPSPRRRPYKTQQIRRKAAAKALMEDLGPLKLLSKRRSATGSTSGNVERMQEIQRLLAIGMTRDEVVEFSFQEWGLEQQAVDRALETIRDRWVRHDAEAAPFMRSQYKRSLNIVLQASMVEISRGGHATQAHSRNALKALDQLARIDGVYTPERLVITSVAPSAEEVETAAKDLADIMALMGTRPVPDPDTRH